MYGALRGLRGERALWVRPDLFAWPNDRLPGDEATFVLYAARSAGLELSRGIVLHSDSAYLLRRCEIPAEVAEQHRVLEWYSGLGLDDPVDVEDLLTQELAVGIAHPDGHVSDLTGIQTPLVLDAVFAAQARSRRFGVTHHSDGSGVFTLWAPTARSVEVLVWPPDAGPAPPVAEAMPYPAERHSDGSWVARVPDVADVRYLYRVDVYAPTTERFERNLVTDPYSVALTLGSARSVAADPADQRWRPDAWSRAPQPRLEHPVDAAIYELHVRDFSMADELVPEHLRGSYLAFDVDGYGRRHLRTLGAAGLNTVQLLPVFDSAAITDDKDARREPGDLSRFAADSPYQQRVVAKVKAIDGYNWGYDPFHWLAPEGSYASTNEAADGGHRMAELRTMIGAIHALGLRVTVDQVFNHTHAAGQWPASVLDKIVPGYYHRRDAEGGVYQTTCCDNIATEHAMAEQIMIDACVFWAREHKVDGFRFDLMGFHSRQTMERVRSALDTLTVERDGIDGRQVSMYGEGWDFGEVAGDRLFVQAAQGRLAGTGIATFTDRLRDAVRGGGAFDPDPRRQGFGSGAGTRDNGVRLANSLGDDTDLLQLGLAANLRAFTMVDHRGQRVSGVDVPYRGIPAAYAEEPDEVLSYVDAHDNETLWDALTMKLDPALPMAERVRHNTLALACATLAQTAVMWHAGSDLLRSKSLDRNSYNSGDWFNRLDWTGHDNGFGRGLPTASENGHVWRLLRRFLGRPEFKPAAEHVREAAAAAHDLLRLRNSTRLYRLGSAERIRSMVAFPVAGTGDAVPGCVAYLVDDPGPDAVCPHWRSVLTIFNGTPETVAQRMPGLGGDWQLSPVQQSGSDLVVRSSHCMTGDGLTFVVPARTVAAFVRPW